MGEVDKNQPFNIIEFNGKSMYNETTAPFQRSVALTQTFSFQFSEYREKFRAKKMAITTLETNQF